MPWRYLLEFEQTQYLSAKELHDLQLRRLEKLLFHAHATCPYYARLFSDYSFHPSQLSSLDDLARLPLLNKEILQRSRQDLVSTRYSAKDLIPNYSGGSSGRPVLFYADRSRLYSRWAATVRHNRWADLDFGDKLAVIWGAPRDRLPKGIFGWIKNRILHQQLFLDASHLTESVMLAFDEQLKQFRPSVILAYAQAISLFARFLQARKRTPYQPRSIITSAEMLYPADRDLLQAVFGCPVYNRYGCREFSVIASECSAHDGLHLMAEGLLVELSSFPSGGKEGEILVTDLLNYAMPLIRYRIGDLGEWAEGPCKCGRQLPRLKKICGRVTDFLVGTSDQLISGVFLATYLIGSRPSLGQVQIYQTTPGEILYKVSPPSASLTCEDADYLIRGTKKYLGDQARCYIEIVKELPPAPSGKYLIARSTVTPSFLSSPPSGGMS